jgi:Domain of unknown function (DUF4034)
MSKPAGFIAFVLWISLLCASANAGVDQAPGFLKAKRYDALDKLYGEVSAGPFAIHEEPELLVFFTSLLPKESEPDAVWQSRLAELDAWNAEAPESKAALLARATFYNAYALKGRTRELAVDVSPQGWRFFEERRAKAMSLLKEAKARLETEIHYHYLLVLIQAPDRESHADATKHVRIVAKKAPGYWPVYDALATYLQVSWGTSRDALPDFAKTWSDALGGDDGDILYARLMGYAAYSEGANFLALCKPDGARIARGYDAVLKRVNSKDPGERLKWLAGYAHTMARLGDWRRARSAMLRMGKTNYFGYWGGEEGYLADLEKSGARGDIVSAALLEQRGKMDEAERAYLSFEPEKAVNPWLRDFYLRHGRAADYAVCSVYDLERPVDEVSLNDAAELTRVYAALHDWEKARALAQRFDAARGHNISGKLTLYYVALATGDAAAAGQAREAIINLKTNRKSYQQAQAALRGEQPLSLSGASRPDWSDGYVFQALTAVALRHYELGQAAEARALLSEAARRCHSINEREWMNALMLQPPSALAAAK